MTPAAVAPQEPQDLVFRELLAFPSLEDIKLGDLFALSLTNKTNPFTHGLHRFPAKFIPQVPRWALSQFGGPGRTVLDPFAGSGTTLVEALVHGENAIGLDIDPLARLISRAKTSMVSPVRLTEFEKTFDRGWTQPSMRLQLPMPDVSNFAHWFSEESWGWLQSLRDMIMDLECSPPEREFLLAVFSSVLRWVSNADDQSQKTYVSGTLKKNPPHARRAFLKALRRAIEGVQELSVHAQRGARAVVLDNGDAADIPLPDASVDLVVTSPPYLDSVDYMYNLMLEYFWLGPLLGVPSRVAFNERRRQVIGAKSPSYRSTLIPFVQDLVGNVGLPEDRRLAVNGYFDLMNVHFREAARCLREGGRYVLVIGNSQTRHNIIPVHEALVRLAGNHGLSVEQVFGYRVRRHYMKFPRAGRGGIILIDWVIVLRNTGTATDLLHGLPLPWITLAPGAVAH